MKILHSFHCKCTVHLNAGYEHNAIHVHTKLAWDLLQLCWTTMLRLWKRRAIVGFVRIPYYLRSVSQLRLMEFFVRITVQTKSLADAVEPRNCHEDRRRLVLLEHVLRVLALSPASGPQVRQVRVIEGSILEQSSAVLHAQTSLRFREVRLVPAVLTHAFSSGARVLGNEVPGARTLQVAMKNSTLSECCINLTFKCPTC